MEMRPGDAQEPGEGLDAQILAVVQLDQFAETAARWNRRRADLARPPDPNRARGAAATG